MIYHLGELYKLLDKYAENDIEEEEHGFISNLKWPDKYALNICNDDFWEKIQESYDIFLQYKTEKKFLRLVI